MRKILAFLAMMLVAVACGAKKLWGVDVASKEDVRVTHHAATLQARLDLVYYLASRACPYGLTAEQVDSIATTHSWQSCDVLRP